MWEGGPREEDGQEVFLRSQLGSKMSELRKGR